MVSVLYVPAAQGLHVRSEVSVHAASSVLPAAHVVEQAVHEIAPSVVVLYVPPGQLLQAPTSLVSDAPHEADKYWPGPHVVVHASHELGMPVPALNVSVPHAVHMRSAFALQAVWSRSPAVHVVEQGPGKL